MLRLIYSLLFILFCSCLFLDNAQSLRRRDKNADFFVPAGVFQPEKTRENLPSVKQMHYQGEQAPVIIEIEKERLAKQEDEKKHLQDEKRKADIEKKALEQMQKHKSQAKTKTQKTEIDSVKEEILKPEIIEEPKLHGYDLIMYEYQHDLENISKGLPVQNQRLEQMIGEFDEEVHTVE